MSLFFLKNLQKNGISTEIYSLINDAQVKSYTNLVVSNCSAYDYLNNAIPNLEKLTTQYYDTFSISSRFTGYLSNITIGDFYNSLSSSCCDGTAILGGLNSTARTDAEKKSNNVSSSNSSSNSSDSSNSSNSSSTQNNSSSEQDVKNQEEQNIATNPDNLLAGNTSIIGEQGIENLGIAIFNKDILCGELTATESICHLLITNDVDSCIISIVNPLSTDEKMELQLTPAKNSKISTKINSDSVKISIDINVDADIKTLEENIDYANVEILDEISCATKDYLKNEFNSYLNKLSKEYNSDIDHFGIHVLKHFATIDDFENFNWKEKFSNAEFEVNVNVNMISSLLITRT